MMGLELREDRFPHLLWVSSITLMADLESRQVYAGEDLLSLWVEGLSQLQAVVSSLRLGSEVCLKHLEVLV